MKAVGQSQPIGLLSTPSKPRVFQAYTPMLESKAGRCYLFWLVKPTRRIFVVHVGHEKPLLSGMACGSKQENAWRSVERKMHSRKVAEH